MSDYFIPLPTLLPSIVGIPLEKIPGFGPLYKKYGVNVGVRDLHQTWNDTYTTVSGEAVIDTEIELELGGFALVAGNADGEQTTFRFELSSSRESLLDLLAADASGADPAIVAFLETDAYPKKSRTVIHGLGLKLRLPREHAHLGERIMEGAEVVGVRAVVPAKPVDIALPQATLILDTDEGISITIDDQQVVECPPFLLGDSGIGFEVRDLKLDLSNDSGIPEVLARPGYDETWQGVYVGALAVYNLDKLLPFLPRKIEATNWIIGSEGWSGAVDVEFPAAAADAVWHPGQLGIEFDHGALVRGTISAVFKVGSISNELVTLGPEGNLEVLFTLRHNPAVSGAEAWGFEIALLTPGHGDTGLLTFSEEFLDAAEVLLPGIALTALAMDSAVSAGDILVFLLLNALTALQLANKIVIKRLTLDTLRFRYYTRQIGDDVVRLIDVVFDWQARLAIDIDVVILVVKTDRPIGVDLKGLTLRWVVSDFDALPEATRTALGGKFQFEWEVQGGVTFDLSEQSLVKNSPVEFFKFGIGRWEKGLWFDIGVRSTASLSEAYGGGGAVRLFYLADGSFDHAELQGISVTVLIPEVIYCRADLGWGDVKLISTKALFVGNGTASLAPPNPTDPLGKLRAYTKRSAWLFEAEVLMRLETLPSGAESLVIGIDVNMFCGIPLGASGVSLFGFLGQYAQNARPNVVDGDYLTWFSETPSFNSVIGPNKWIGADGSWGFGLGAVLGSTPDLGRTWNAKVGLTLVIPGPVIVIYGAANILEPKPAVGDASGGNFIALIVLDFEENTFTLGLTVQYFVPKPDGTLLVIKIPAEIFVDVEEAANTHVYLGEHLPISRRITARALGLFDFSGYLMIDGKTIANLAGKGIDIPGFAIAFGGRAEFRKGLKAGPLKCSFFLGVEVHLGVGLPDPFLFFGLARIDGGLVVKVFGFGFELVVWAQLTIIAPEPFLIKGEIGVRIGLPWPIPDIEATVSLTLVDSGNNIGPPGDIDASIDFVPRNENRALKLSQSALTEGVSVDPTFTLTFRFPIRNVVETVGSFNLYETNSTTRYMTTEENGYAFTLEDLRLVNLNTNAVKADLPATWRKESTKARRGEEARMVLDLLSYDSIITSRFVGASATYVDGTTKDWEPCRPPKRDGKKVCYDFERQPVGLIAPAVLVLPRPPRPDARVRVARPPANAETLLTTFGYRARRAEVMTIPLPDPIQVVALPATEGVAGQTPHACETLILEFERALELTLTCVRRGQRAGTAVARFFDGRRLVGTVIAQTIASAHGFEFLEVASPAAATRVEIRAWNSFVTGTQHSGRFEDRVFLVRFCMHYESELIYDADSAASMGAWSNFWSDLLAQDAAASDALLLDPDTPYRIEGRVRWVHVEDPSSGADQSFAFSFRTEAADREIKPLRKRDPLLPISEDRWEIDTLPGDGTFAMYTERAIRLIFSSPRIEAVFAKFGEKLVLRLIDDQGRDLFDTLEMLREQAADLPEYQKVWQQTVLDAPCTPDGASTLWDIGVAVFDTILQPNRDYTASLHVLPALITDFTGVEWKDFPIVHGFKFRTSRWSDLTAHIGAHELHDEIADAPPDLAQIAADTGAVTGRIEDDQLLERVLYERIGLPVRAPAKVPEATLVWRQVGAAYSAIGVLLDGPEPLLREEGSTIAITLGAGVVDFLHLTGKSRTRSLLLFSAGGTFAPRSSQTITITVTDMFINSSGVAASEVASLSSIVIPAAPSIFAEEAAP